MSKALGVDRGGSARQRKNAWLVCFWMLSCIVILARQELANGFSMLPGDRYDAVITAALHEHWYNFMLGNAGWTDVRYFYPYDLTIAQSDAYLINGILYVPFRIIGLDPFVSVLLSAYLIKVIGFISMYLLCRRFCATTIYWPLLAAILFTLSNGMTVHSSRVQLATVAFAPLLALLLWRTIDAFLAGTFGTFRRFGVLSSVLFGAWCLTCFYMAWFFAFFFSIFILTLLIVCSKGGLVVIRTRLSSGCVSVAFVGCSLALSLIPFIYAFLPKARESGVRAYEEVLRWTVPLEGILQVGEENLLLGQGYKRVLSYLSPSYAPSGEYYNTGIAVLLMLFFVLGSIRALKVATRSAEDTIVLAVVVATVVSWVLTLNVNGTSAWFIVFHLFPGAKALRVVSAYQIFLMLPVVIVAVKYLSTCHISRAAIVLVSSVLVVEELNSPVLNLNRRVELERIALPAPAPKDCRAFYVSGWNGQENLGSVGSIYAHNVSAMFVAQIAQIPTINGIASFNPPDWNFGSPFDSTYEERVLNYARLHNVNGLCEFDLNGKVWSGPVVLRSERAPVNFPFFDNSKWDGNIVAINGLSHAEDWGVWSSSGTVEFVFDRLLPEKFAVRLSARAFGPNVGKEFLAQVDDEVVKFVLGAEVTESLLAFHGGGLSRGVVIRIPYPVSPKELGVSEDSRKLGIGIVSLSIKPL